MILSLVPKINRHEVPSYYDSHANTTTKELQSGSMIFGKDPTCPAYNKPVRIHCKAGSASVRLVFETRGKCQDFVGRYKDDGIPFAINSPFCRTSATFTVRQSRSIEDREIGKQFAPLWKVLADQLKNSLP